MNSILASSQELQLIKDLKLTNATIISKDKTTKKTIRTLFKISQNGEKIVFVPISTKELSSEKISIIKETSIKNSTIKELIKLIFASIFVTFLIAILVMFL